MTCNTVYLIVVLVGLLVVFILAVCLSAWCCKGMFPRFQTFFFEILLRPSQSSLHSRTDLFTQVPLKTLSAVRATSAPVAAVLVCLPTLFAYFSVPRPAIRSDHNTCCCMLDLLASNCWILATILQSQGDVLAKVYVASSISSCASCTECCACSGARGIVGFLVRS